MRWLLVLVLALSVEVDARVIMTPTIPRACASGDSWRAVKTCLARFGKPTVVRERAGVKLVQIAADRFGVPGLYLYLERKGRWTIAGMFEMHEGDAELLRFDAVTLAKHTGYRFELGLVYASTIALGGNVSVPARFQQRTAVFCAGLDYRCEAITTACDVFVGGKAYWSFRGKLAYDGSIVRITGDRRNAGPFCDQDDEVQLGWPQ